MRTKYTILSRALYSNLRFHTTNQFLKTNLQFSKPHNMIVSSRLFSDTPKIKTEKNEIEATKAIKPQEATAVNQQSPIGSPTTAHKQDDNPKLNPGDKSHPEIKVGKDDIESSKAAKLHETIADQKNPIEKPPANPEQGSNPKSNPGGKSQSGNSGLFNKAIEYAKQHPFGVLAAITGTIAALYRIYSEMENNKKAEIKKTEEDVDKILQEVTAVPLIKKDAQTIGMEIDTIKQLISDIEKCPILSAKYKDYKIEQYSHLNCIVSNDCMSPNHDGEGARNAAIKIKEAIEEYLVRKEPRSKIIINGVNANPMDGSMQHELYLKLNTYGQLLSIYIKALHALGRTYLYMGSDRIEDAEKYQGYFELAKALGEKGNFFEAHLSQSNGLLIIKRDESEKLIKDGHKIQAISVLKGIIASYDERIADNKQYNDFRFAQATVPITPANNDRCIADCQEYQMKCYLDLMKIQPTEENAKGLSSVITKVKFDNLDDRKVSTLLNLFGEIVLEYRSWAIQDPIPMHLSDQIKKSVTLKSKFNELEATPKSNGLAYNIFLLSSTLVDDKQFQKADAYGGAAKALKLIKSTAQDADVIKGFDQEINQHESEENRINTNLKRPQKTSNVDTINGGAVSSPPRGTLTFSEKEYGGFWREYYPEAVDVLLPLRLVASDVRISKSLILNERYKDNQYTEGRKGVYDYEKNFPLMTKMVDEIYSFINDAIDNTYTSALIPIVYKSAPYSSHWIGLVFEKLGSNLQITYIDPENKPIPIAVKQALSDAIAAVKNNNAIDAIVDVGTSPTSAISEHSSVISASLIQAIVEEQAYSNNCGPELIEHFAQIITGHRVLQDKAIEVHSRLLETSLMDVTNGLSTTVPLSLSMTLSVTPIVTQNALIALSDFDQRIIRDFAHIKKGESTQFFTKFTVEGTIFVDYLNYVVNRYGISGVLKSFLYRQEIAELKSVLNKYNIETSIDDVLTNKGFKTLALKLHPDKGGNAQDFMLAKDLRDKFEGDINIKSLVDGQMQTWLPKLYKVATSFKVVDTAMDSVRLYQIPTFEYAKQVTLDSLHVYSMYSGFTKVSIAANILSTSYIYYEHGLYPALQQGIFSTAFMFLPAMITGKSPYLGFLYTATMAGYNGYHTINNAYSLFQEHFGSDYINRSAQELKSYTAYLDGAKWLAETTNIKFFTEKAHEYAVKISTLKTNIEKQSTEVQLKTKYGEEFGNKLFKCIYEPYIEEKHNLEAQAGIGQLSQQEEENFLALSLVSIPNAGYEICRFDDSQNNKSFYGEGAVYYCHSEEAQTLDIVLVAQNGEIEVIDQL